MVPSIEIIRLQEDFDYGTFGALKINSVLFCWTLERADLENKQNVSSIPAQQYMCQRIRSPKFGSTFEVTNVPGRTHILLHPANLMEELEGCIALGEKLGYLGGNRAILNSGNTFKRFMTALEGVNKFHLTINEVY